ncbi:nicotinate-nucleotide--dimethylbenzimidazole phosphoribosyltransferase [Streptomyces sp. CLI2509]|uniref:nicotinate-nucleotide--dimethylbenzimidazole phosphoribosyltransferase n=2 Tax=unclassified Streptomyces TaxID=2593676 RepID=UPI000BAC943C|nr:nicotinate-nucleotide--dimethylbenzimidazole phosphoribosyltransferase [Streptomyces sp. CLI2509]ASY35868.1 5,6-dimethylbenzimidazole synthase [Streptomyces sp. CLI2509]
MTDTGKGPAEGQPQAAAQPGPYPYQGYAAAPAEDDDLLFMPGAQGAWTEAQPVLAQPVQAAYQGPGTEQSAQGSYGAGLPGAEVAGGYAEAAPVAEAVARTVPVAPLPKPAPVPPVPVAVPVAPLEQPLQDAVAPTPELDGQGYAEGFAAPAFEAQAVEVPAAEAAVEDQAAQGPADAAQVAEGQETPAVADAPAQPHAPEPHETDGRDSGAVDLSAVRATATPARAQTPQRRPLHMGPALPDPRNSPVRTLADRGPAAPRPEYATTHSGTGWTTVPAQPPAPAPVAPDVTEWQPAAGTAPAPETDEAVRVAPAVEPQEVPAEAPEAAAVAEAEQAAAPEAVAEPDALAEPAPDAEAEAVPVPEAAAAAAGPDAVVEEAGEAEQAAEPTPEAEPAPLAAEPPVAETPAEAPAEPEPVVTIPAQQAGPVAPEEAPEPAGASVSGEAPVTAGTPVPGEAAAPVEAPDAPAPADASAPAERPAAEQPAAAEPEPVAAPEESVALPEPPVAEPAAEETPAAHVMTPPAPLPHLPGTPVGAAHWPSPVGAVGEQDPEDVPEVAQDEQSPSDGAAAPEAGTTEAAAPEVTAPDATAPEAAAPEAAPDGTAPIEAAPATEPPADSPAASGAASAPVPPQAPAGPPAPGYDEAEREAVLRVMRERRDIRNGFRSDPIPHEVLLRVLEAAHTAPSVGHSQPWDFVVIRSEETRRAMHELAEKQRDAYAASLPKGRAKQFRELKIEAILDTPVNIVVTADPTRGGRHTLGRHTQPQMAPYSSALAVENLWLAARAEGLGVGWVSFFDEREMVRALGLPEHLEVVAYLCVGYVDEFPDEPELMQAGWSKRRPLSWVVHEETYGRRVLPGAEPADLLTETVRRIRPLDAKALGEAWERQKRMTKPPGALGMLEIISAQLSGLSRTSPPPIPEPAAVAIFAGDHGVHAQGVTAWPQEVTAQMVANFLGGGAVCNAFAKQVGAEVCVVDVGVAAELPPTPGLLPRKVRAGTADMTAGPALSREDVTAAIEVGIETARDLVAAGNKALLTGEMGIANTTASAALISVFTGTDPAEVTGRGTGINDEMHAHKIDVIRRALGLHRPDPADPVGVLAAVGGLEHAAMAGLLLGGASLRTPVILDGVSAGAAALVARAIAPEVLAACIAGHRSAEPGHVAALNSLGLRPLVDLDLRLGEGTGALLALPLVQSAARAMHEVATFDSAGVTEK